MTDDTHMTDKSDNNYGIKETILQIALLGGIGLIGYLTYSFFSSLKPVRITPTLDDIYDVESHNPDLSPYDMTNVGIPIDAKVVDRSAWDAWWIYYVGRIPVIITTGKNILYLEYGKMVEVNDAAYSRARVGDRVIVWKYITDGDFSPNRYDIYRNDILIYRRISILDYIAP